MTSRVLTTIFAGMHINQVEVASRPALATCRGVLLQTLNTVSVGTVSLSDATSPSNVRVRVLTHLTILIVVVITLNAMVHNTFWRKYKWQLFRPNNAISVERRNGYFVACMEDTKWCTMGHVWNIQNGVRWDVCGRYKMVYDGTYMEDTKWCTIGHVWKIQNGVRWDMYGRYKMVHDGTCMEDTKWCTMGHVWKIQNGVRWDMYGRYKMVDDETCMEDTKWGTMGHVWKIQNGVRWDMYVKIR